MIKPGFFRGSCMALILVFLFVLCTMAGPATAQKIEIALRDSPLPFTPNEFYIASVIDMRDNRDAAGWLLMGINNSTGEKKTLPADFAAGWFNAVKRFIDHNVPKNTSLHPVEIGLKTFRLTETKLPDNRVEGHVNLNLSFDLQTAYAGPHHLTGYNGSAVYTRNAGNPQDIGPILTHALVNGLAYFNNWMNKAAETNIYLAKGVKLSFTDYKENTEGDTIYYAADRPLTWADFQSNVANSKYDADVFPSIGYDEQLEVNKSIINIRIDLKAFLPKSACWVKNGSRNDYTLNHEQRHFDIAKISAERFKQKLKAENLPVGNYDGYINVDYLDAYREMNALQKQYDDETRHGSNQYEQQKWNDKIDSLLRSP
jgi:hypothetical protein